MNTAFGLSEFISEVGAPIGTDAATFSGRVSMRTIVGRGHI